MFKLLFLFLTVGGAVYVAPVVFTMLQIIFFEAMINFLSTFEISHGG